MFNRKSIRIIGMGLCVLFSLVLVGCTNQVKINKLSELSNKVFGVPRGTIADELVLSMFPNATFKYYDSVFESCLAVKSGIVDAAAYDEPILKNIAGKYDGFKVLEDMITIDNYGFAVKLKNESLKAKIDKVIKELKATGKYDEMKNRWLPEKGSPDAMPTIKLTGKKGVLKFGTAAITEPFSYINSKNEVVGMDIEIAKYVAKEMNMKLKVINMKFGDLLPSVISGKIDFAGACITISDERKKSVLFSNPYYTGGIAALVSK